MVPAWINKDGNVVIRSTRMVNETRNETITAIENGVPVTRVRAVTVSVPVMVHQSYKAKDLQVFDVAGKRVDAKQWKEALAKERVVALSVDGRPLDVGFRSKLKKGTLILVPPATPAKKGTKTNVDPEKGPLPK
jgi:hypothetical protein